MVAAPEAEDEEAPHSLRPGPDARAASAGRLFPGDKDYSKLINNSISLGLLSIKCNLGFLY